LNELNELRLKAYESSQIYKERAKRWHDKHIFEKRFDEEDMVLLFNSKLRLFLGKLRSQWSKPFQVTKVHPHAMVEVWSESISLFKVNVWRLKHYFLGGSLLKKVAIHTLTNPDHI